MRLQLDTTSNDLNNATQASETKSANGSAAAGGNAVKGSINGGFGTEDRASVSGASGAWAASFTDRTARIQQLTLAVQSGTYRIPSAAISQAIITHAGR